MKANDTTVVVLLLLAVGTVGFVMYRERARERELAQQQAAERLRQQKQLGAGTVPTDIGQIAGSIGTFVGAGADLYHNLFG